MDAFSFVDVSAFATVQDGAKVEDIPVADSDKSSSNPGTLCVIA